MSRTTVDRQVWPWTRNVRGGVVPTTAMAVQVVCVLCDRKTIPATSLSHSFFVIELLPYPSVGMNQEKKAQNTYRRDETTQSLQSIRTLQNAGRGGKQKKGARSLRATWRLLYTASTRAATEGRKTSSSSSSCAFTFWTARPDRVQSVHSLLAKSSFFSHNSPIRRFPPHKRATFRATHQAPAPLPDRVQVRPSQRGLLVCQFDPAPLFFRHPKRQSQPVRPFDSSICSLPCCTDAAGILTTTTARNKENCRMHDDWIS
jgi:hypothetical protein